MTAPIRPKRKISTTDYAKYRKEGYSHEEITSEADVVAPDMAGSALQGMSTFMDEVEGAVKGTGTYLAKKLRGKPTTFRGEVEDAQYTAEKAATQLPGITLAAGLATPFGLGNTVDRAFKVSRNAGPIMRGAKAIAAPTVTGALSGVATGYGIGHGEERSENALKYGLGGGVGGALMGAVQLMHRYAMQFFGEGREGLAMTRAGDAVNRTMTRIGVPDDKLRGNVAREVLDGAQGPNVPILNADRAARSVVEPRAEMASGKRVMDTSRPMQELARDVADISPNAEARLEQTARQRIAEEPNAVVDDMADALQVPRNANSADRSTAMLRRKVAEEDEAFPLIFQQHGRSIDTPEIREAWNDIRPYVIREIEAEAQIRGVPITRFEVQRGNLGYAPTLEGVHRAKKVLQDRMRAIESRRTPDDGLMGTYTIGVARLKGLAQGQQGQQPPLANVPGGARYLQELERSSQDRSVLDALNAGQDMALSTQSPEKVRATVAGAMPSGGADVTTARRVTGGLRRGAVTKARQDAGGTGRASVLDEASAPNTQDAMREMQPLSPGADERMRVFGRKTEDRRTMRETNQIQTRKATQDKIIEGERPTGTALGFGQSRLLGEAAALNIQALPGPLKLVAGALLSKALQGQRAEATRLAADELERFVQLQADDPEVAKRIYDLMTRNMRKQITDMRGGIQRGIAAPLFARYAMDREK